MALFGKGFGRTRNLYCGCHACQWVRYITSILFAVTIVNIPQHHVSCDPKDRAFGPQEWALLVKYLAGRCTGIAGLLDVVVTTRRRNNTVVAAVTPGEK